MTKPKSPPSWMDGRTREGKALRAARAASAENIDPSKVTGVLQANGKWLYGIIPGTVEIDRELKQISFQLNWSSGEVKHYTLPLERVAGYEKAGRHESAPGAPLARGESFGVPGLSIGAFVGQSEELSTPDEQDQDTTTNPWLEALK